MVQFSARGQVTAPVAWTITPPGGGTITAAGMFTASSTPGAYTIEVHLTQNASVSATTQVTVLPFPNLSGLSADLDQAEGSAQTAQGGFLNNSPVAGEPEQATVSGSANGFISVRSGFTPPAQSLPATSQPAQGAAQKQDSGKNH